MEFSRELNPAVSPLERIKDFSEFHAPLVPEQRKTQAARCMNCGVPFCQSGVAYSGGAVSGCPLHNLIPEWNDEIYNGNDREALSRLLKTNDFPEFTGRVCPALCEAACTCGLNDDPVTVRENELYTIETGFANGWMEPKIPKIRTDKRIAVIGSGPSGLAAADRLNQRGHNVTVFERDSRPGGLLMYGIPNMKLEKSIVERRIKLMKQEGVIFRCGTDIGKDIDAQTIVDSFDAVIICCGAKEPRALKTADESVNGIMYAVDFLSDSTRVVIGEKDESVSAKDKNVIIVGGGDTGNDCVGTSIRQGCKSVIQLEMMPKLPDERAENNPWPQWPRVCKTDYGQEEAIAVFGADPRIYQTTVSGIVTNEKGELTAVKTVKLEPKTVDGRMVMHEVENSEEELPCELLLIAAGFTGCQSYVPEAFGITRTPRGTVETEANGYATDTEKIFAAGDARRGQSLVVWAIAEGRACAKEVDEYLMQYTDMI